MDLTRCLTLADVLLHPQNRSSQQQNELWQDKGAVEGRTAKRQKKEEEDGAWWGVG